MSFASAARLCPVEGLLHARSGVPLAPTFLAGAHKPQIANVRAPGHPRDAAGDTTGSTAPPRARLGGRYDGQ